MKPERKPFVVEVKKRRSVSKNGQSIWGAIDLKSVANEARVEQETGSQDISPVGSVSAKRKRTDTAA